MNITPSRRKLILKRTIAESDLSKAVILYQPPEKFRNFGRNLAKSNHKQETIKTFSHSDASAEPTTNPRIRNYRFYIYSLILTIIAVSVFFCKVPYESCPTDSMEIDLTFVGNELRKFVYGQNVAINIITETLERMCVTVENISVFLLYGGQGTGKTWTTHVVSRSLPKNVRKIYLHLELLSHQEIIDRLGNVQCCRWNFLFIEDSDYVSPMKVELMALALGKLRETVCPNLKIVVMLMSSVGQQELTKVLFQQLQNGLTRQSIELLRLDALKKQLSSPLVTALNKNRLHFTPVPYFPLGKEEVEMCIIQDFKHRRKEMSVSLIHKIMKDIKLFPPKLEFFAVSGCKMVSSKVNMYV